MHRRGRTSAGQRRSAAAGGSSAWRAGLGPGRGGPTSERAAGRENFVPCLVSTCFRRAFAQAAVSGSEIRWRASSLAKPIRYGVP